MSTSLKDFVDAEIDARMWRRAEKRRRDSAEERTHGALRFDDLADDVGDAAVGSMRSGRQPGLDHYEIKTIKTLEKCTLSQ